MQVYHEKVQTTAVFLRDTTPVTPFTLLLFGGAIQVQHSTGAVTVDKWIQFSASGNTAPQGLAICLCVVLSLISSHRSRGLGHIPVPSIFDFVFA